MGHRATANGNNQRLLLALAPLLLVVGVTLLTNVTQQIRRAQPGASLGRMSEREARRLAENFCGRFVDQGMVTAQEASGQTAYGKRRDVVINEWGVLCDTDKGEYLVRINSNTRRVFAVNRISDPNGQPLWSEAGNVKSKKGSLSKQQAEKQALRYLRMVGVRMRDVRTVRPATQSSMKNGEVWNFTYRRQIAGKDGYLVKVTVNSATGGLENVWNPTSAL
jgi:hypothetical protein